MTHWLPPICPVPRRTSAMNRVPHLKENKRSDCMYYVYYQQLSVQFVISVCWRSLTQSFHWVFLWFQGKKFGWKRKTGKRGGSQKAKRQKAGAKEYKNKSGSFSSQSLGQYNYSRKKSGSQAANAPKAAKRPGLLGAPQSRTFLNAGGTFMGWTAGGLSMMFPYKLVCSLCTMQMTSTSIVNRVQLYRPSILIRGYGNRLYQLHTGHCSFGYTSAIRWRGALL